MVYPTHYTGEAGYISDTESSEIVPDIIKNSLDGTGQKADKGSKEMEVKKLEVDLSATNAPSENIIAVEEITKELHTEL